MSPWGRSSAAEALEKQERERRGGDRRVQRRYRFFERRSGFERREPEPTPGSGSLLARSLAHLRRSPRALLLLLVAINLLNVADYASTLVALRVGVEEANPFMAALFAQGPAVAGVTKISLVLLVTGLLWTLRRFKRALMAALFVGAALLAVLAYHLAGLGAWLAAG